jgi:hypothetical protein
MGPDFFLRDSLRLEQELKRGLVALSAWRSATPATIASSGGSENHHGTSCPRRLCPERGARA